MEDKFAQSARVIMDAHDYMQLKNMLNFRYDVSPSLFVKNDEYYSLDILDAMCYLRHTDPPEKACAQCLLEYLEYIAICKRRIANTSGEKTQIYLSKLDFLKYLANVYFERCDFSLLPKNVRISLTRHMKEID